MAFGFVSFTRLPAEFPAFAFQDFSRYLEFFVFENVSLCVFFIQESPHPGIPGYFARRKTLRQVLNLNCPFLCSDMKITQQPVQLLWEDFQDLSFFATLI